MNDDTELIRTLDAFAAEWNSGDSVPRISGYLQSDGAGEEARRRLAVELIKLDLEERWQRGLRRVVEDYAEDVPGLESLMTPDLLLEEYRIRQRAGDPVSTSEYLQRFPRLAAGLRSVFRLDPALSLTRSLNAAAAKPPALEPGDRIDDFDLLVRLGRGAFAEVFLARQRSLQRLVAVKVSADEGTEPQTLAQLDHESIIRVYDQRRLTDPPVRLLYMQYAAGGTLLDVLQQLRTLALSEWSGAAFLRAIDHTLDSRGESPPPESVPRARLRELGWPEVVCLLGAQLARGLDYAHRRGVLHRDLKPANILLTAEGLPKLADFNISFGAGVEGDSAERNFGGSIAYMSPEQLEVCHPAALRAANDLDGRSDQYALGVVLLELLSGQKPFRHESDASTWTAQLEGLIDSRRAPPGPRAMAALSTGDRCGLADVLRTMLHPDREHRYSSCGVAAAALELCLQPAARRLLQVPAHSWRSTLQSWPVVSVVGATLLPNVVAAVFNFLYNRNEIRLQLPAAETTFMRVQSLINLVAFPVGIVCVGWLIRSLTQRSGHDTVQRVACLQLGLKASLVGLTLWLIAAPAYPLLLRMMLPAVPGAIYGHFVVSLIVCGLIAAAYPFLLVSLIALRCLLPALLPDAALTARDRSALNRLATQSWIALTLAAAVPMVAVLVLALSGLDRRQALVVLAAAGTAGFGFAVTAFRLLQRDTQTLLRLPATQNERGSEAM